MHREFEGLQVMTIAAGPGDTIQIHTAGELDLASLDVLGTALHGALEAGSGDVEVESSEMTFCDSSGLCLLLTAQRDLNAGRTAVVSRQPGARPAPAARSQLHTPVVRHPNVLVGARRVAARLMPPRVKPPATKSS